MNSVQIVAIISVLVTISAAFINSYKIRKKLVRATLSSWLIFFACTSTSFASYLASPNRNLIGGSLNATDVLGDIIVILSILFFSVSKWRLKPFEKYYLIALGLIGVFWFFTKDAFHSNLLIQVLLTLGYVPTIHNIIKLKYNPESFTVWGIILAGSTISLYPAYYTWQRSHNMLGFIYSLRSAVCIGILMMTMFFYKPPKIIPESL